MDSHGAQSNRPIKILLPLPIAYLVCGSQFRCTTLRAVRRRRRRRCHSDIFAITLQMYTNHRTNLFDLCNSNSARACFIESSLFLPFLRSRRKRTNLQNKRLRNQVDRSASVVRQVFSPDPRARTTLIGFVNVPRCRRPVGDRWIAIP